MVIWVAIGGRNSLFGAILGTLAVNFGKDVISSAFPELWLYIVGAIFVLVVTILPQGIMGLASFPRRGPRITASAAAPPATRSQLRVEAPRSSWNSAQPQKIPMSELTPGNRVSGMAMQEDTSNASPTRISFNGALFNAHRI